jgi:serine/threonine-protein kinase
LYDLFDMEQVIKPKLDNQERSALSTPEVPKDLIVDRYEVVQTLSGGMGLVHLCRDHIDNRPVALKTFKPEFLSHVGARDLFLREGTMWVEIGRHPHIVRAHRVERTADGLEVYLVLSWIVQPPGKDSPSLRSWLQNSEPLPIRQALTFILHIVRGMKYAASQINGLVHRDLKPENVLVGHDGNARVTDFGLASTLSEMKLGGHRIASLPSTRDNFGRTQLTQGIAGTPLYMAPEQWNHQLLDARADIYALGCIFYEMVTGRLAAEGETKEKLREIHLSGRIKPPPPSTHPAVVFFMRQCMMKNREQRFRNWYQVEEALLRVYWTVLSEEPPEEVLIDDDTREERLAAGDSYNTMGLSYLDIGKLSVAVMYFEQAVWIGRAEKAPALEGRALGNLGLAYKALGYIERAIEFQEEHLAIARELKD